MSDDANTDTTQGGTRRGVLVAVDGSESSGRSLTWAASEARRRGVPLTIAHCYYWPSSGLGAMDAIGFLMDGLAKDSQDVLVLAEQTARERVPGIEVLVESHLGAPVATIVDMSTRFELVVVGSRGLGGFKGMLLGSVSIGVVANAQSPVVVVRSDGEIDPAAPVLVGVDDSPKGRAALVEAFAAAERLGVSLVALHAWTAPAPKGKGTAAEAAAAREADWQQTIADGLDAQVAAVSARFPGVAFETVNYRDRPAAALLARAQTAQLLVVGTRGRSEFKGMMLGSTSRAMVQHSPCPVMVVR